MKFGRLSVTIRRFPVSGGWEFLIKWRSKWDQGIEDFDKERLVVHGSVTGRATRVIRPPSTGTINDENAPSWKGQ